MKPTSQVTALVVSNGLDVSLAVKLAETYKRVFFHVPQDDEFPRVNDAWVGRGMGKIEVVEDMWGSVFDEADLFCFPDLGFPGLQLRLESEGKIVWGGRNGEEMEQDREAMKRHLISIGLPVGEWKAVKGFTALREYLQSHKDVYVKVSRFRGSWESLYSEDYELVKPELDERELALSGVSEEIQFIVEAKLKDVVEMATDGFCIDGQFPASTLVGIEAKDAAYVGAFMRAKDVPKPLREVASKLAPTLRKYGYRGFFSPETMVAKDGRPFLNDPCCFSEDTEILTKSGWKYFKDLTPLESVATLNPKTKRIEYRVPTAFISYQFDGQMVSISSPKKVLDLLVTPNHAVWFEIENGQMSSQAASELNGKKRIPRTGTWEGVPVETFTVPGYFKTWISGRGNSIKKTHSSYPATIPMKDWIRFLAIFLSEGNADSWTVRISQTKYKTEFRNILAALPFPFTEHKKGFVVCSTQLATLLKSTGGRAVRGIPDYVKSLTPEVINVFLDAYVLGDGHIKHGNRNISTTSMRTANDIQELFLKAGSVADIKILTKAGSPVGISNGRYKTKHDSIVIRERKKEPKFYLEGWGHKRQQYLTLKKYSGMVYDVTVPNHIIYVRRNGKPCWSGNCRIPSPPGSLYLEFYTNLGEIIWAGANGEVIEPKAIAPIGMEVVMQSPWGNNHWNTLSWDAKYDRNVKLREACRVGGDYRSIPQGIGLESPGSIIGWGETVEAAETMIRAVAETVKATHLRIPLDAIDDLKETLAMAEKYGLNIMSPEGETEEEEED